MIVCSITLLINMYQKTLFVISSYSFFANDDRWEKYSNILFSLRSSVLHLYIKFPN